MWQWCHDEQTGQAPSSRAASTSARKILSHTKPHASRPFCKIWGGWGWRKYMEITYDLLPLYLNRWGPVSPLYCLCRIFIPFLLGQITDHFGQCPLVSSNVLLSAWVGIG